MSGFIRCFHVYVDKVVVLQRMNAVLCLAFVVGIHPAGYPRDSNDIKARELGDAPHKVNRGYACAREIVQFFERRDMHCLAKSPYPDTVSRVLALRSALYIYRMGFENVPRRFHQVCQLVGAIALGHVYCYVLIRYVVGRERIDLVHAMMPYNEVAVADAGVEGKTVMF